MQNRIEYNRRSFLQAAVRGSVAAGVSVVGLSCATVGTSDFITSLIEKHEKMAWMLRSHIE